MQNILAIDLGTSGPKIAVVSVRGEILASEYVSVKTIYVPSLCRSGSPLHDGSQTGIEQDPREWWQAVVSGVRNIFSRQPQLKDSIIAICSSAQWSGTVAVDEQGQELMNAIIWMDARGAEQIKKLTRSWVNIQGYGLSKLLHWVRKTGGAPGHSGKDSLAHILYIKERFPDIYARTYKFLEPKDYLNLKLTGLFASSYDAMALHWITDNRRIDRVCYDEDLLRLSGLSRQQFPELKQATDVLGELHPVAARELGLFPGVKVIVGSPDLQTAAIGSGAVADFAPHLCLGTSSWLTCHVPHKKSDLMRNMATLPSALPGRYFIGNEQESAGVCLIHLFETMLGPKNSEKVDYGYLESLAKQARQGSNKLIFTPWLNGERTPVESHTVRGGFHNFSLTHQKHDIARSVYEGVAYNSRWLLSSVEHFVGRKLDDIHMIGGGAQSDLWCQIHADILGRTIQQVEEPRFANARGAAWIAALALGLVKREELSALVKIKHSYHPSEQHSDFYSQCFKQFVNIYHANRKVYQQLNS